MPVVRCGRRAGLVGVTDVLPTTTDDLRLPFAPVARDRLGDLLPSSDTVRADPAAELVHALRDAVGA
ncbi:MAG: hypothetical protein JWN08_1040 [Frankiales bacterium]|nr:hypothetical protein [Frankiales bacterium]